MTRERWAEVHAVLRRIGKLGTELLDGAVDALQRGDSASAETVIERAQDMGAERVRVEDLCTRLLDQARPKIPQVRPAVAALQVAQRLERAGQELGGLAEIVRSRRGRAFGDTAFVSLADGVRARLTDAVEGFIAKDADRAQAVLAQQSNAEMHQRNLIESTLRRAAGDPRSIGSDLTLLAAARHLERMSGLAADIADATVREVSTRR